MKADGTAPRCVTARRAAEQAAALDMQDKQDKVEFVAVILFARSSLFGLHSCSRSGSGLIDPSTCLGRARANSGGIVAKRTHREERERGLPCMTLTSAPPSVPPLSPADPSSPIYLRYSPYCTDCSPAKLDEPLHNRRPLLADVVLIPPHATSWLYIAVPPSTVRETRRGDMMHSRTALALPAVLVLAILAALTDAVSMQRGWCS